MNIIYSIIIQPIEEIIEFVFCFVYEKIWSLGIPGAIVAVSLVVNFLALPLYNMADALQLKERQIQLKMAPWIKHIKASFKGDEQFMMLNTWYRQNGYHPLYALRSALSILIEIPFFIAAYHFLSHCSLLHNESFLFLKDLGSPDALFRIGNFTVNVLPILMTSINIVSSAIYTKGAPLREKIQVYVLALVFLVLLYDSPSGLVFYWILNNTFSLAKNFFTKYKKFGFWCYTAFCGLLVLFSLYVLFLRPQTPLNKKIIFWALTFVIVITDLILLYLKKKKIKIKIEKASIQENFPLLLFSLLSLFLLCGFLLPANVIYTSPAEFSNIGSVKNPLGFVFASSLFFFGLFVFWPLIIYKMFNGKVRQYMPVIFFILTCSCVSNAFLFKHNYGLISTIFELDNPENIQSSTIIMKTGPILVIVFVSFLCWLFYKKRRQNILALITIIISIAELSFGTIRSVYTQKEYETYISNLNNYKRFSLSPDGKNVLIFFLDRAISSYFPYIMEQFPELQEAYDGFTYYPNIVSFSPATNMAFPPLVGGYEYTPDEMDKRNTELLSKKHDEAVLVMPRLFADAGYDTTIYEIPYINYNQGITSDYDFTKVGYQTDDVLRKYEIEYADEILTPNPEKYPKKTCIYFTLMQVMYPPFRSYLTNKTTYFYDKPETIVDPYLILNFADLYYMPDAFSYDSEKPTFIFIGNQLTHIYSELNENYRPGALNTDNHHMAPSCPNDPDTNTAAWHVNVAALQQLAKTLQTLKENNVYDNTRILIVSDHGRDIPLKVFNNFDHLMPNLLNPLYLVKDFNATGRYKTDSTFISNAETVNFARKGLGLSDKNPYTGNEFKSAENFDEFIVTNSSQWRVEPMRNSTQFPELNKYSVKENIFQPENWKKR